MRYIDADKLKEAFHTDTEHLQSFDESLFHLLLFEIDEAPTEDAVPREEVARIFAEIEEEIVAALESNYRDLRVLDDGRCNDYILEIVNKFKGKIDALRGIEAFIEELKEKYTKGGE